VNEAPKNRAARLPNFIAVGPPRTATTWLYEVLKGHVGLPANIKETDYFTRFYHRGPDWYADHFRQCTDALPIGEIDPMYFASSEARMRIAKDLPESRIIVSLRDPVERAYSNYRLLRRNTFTKADFERAATTRGDLLESNRYGTHLEKWFETFGRARVLVLFQEDLQANPQAFLDALCDFIAIAHFPVAASQVGSRRVNAIERQPANARLAKIARDLVGWLSGLEYYRAATLVRQSAIVKYMMEGGDPFPPLTPDVTRRMRDFYRPEIEKLEKLIGRELSEWK
jgi:hypothetical protein